MENAVEALKLAFAVIVFVIALTVSINIFNEAKATSDSLLQAEDETNYYDYYNYTDEYASEGSSAAYEKRVVGMETVIPTLYKYYKENYTIVFQTGTYTNGSLSNVQKMVIYKSQSPYWSDMTHNSGKVLWGKYDWKKYWGTNVTENNTKIYDICSFDIDEETKRHEVWSGKTSDAKANLDYFIGGGEFKSPNGNSDYNMNYGKSFTQRLNDKYNTGNDPQFVEQLGEYAYDTSSGNTQTSDTTIEIDGEVTSILRKNKKRVITYTLITNK